MRPGRDADSSLPSRTEVKNRVDLYLCSPKGLRGLRNGEAYLLWHYAETSGQIQAWASFHWGKSST